MGGLGGGGVGGRGGGDTIPDSLPNTAIAIHLIGPHFPKLSIQFNSGLPEHMVGYLCITLCIRNNLFLIYLRIN